MTYDYPSDPVLKLELETLYGLAFVPVGDVETSLPLLSIFEQTCVNFSCNFSFNSVLLQ